MACSFSKSGPKCHIRSNSLPCRSHPSIQRVEEELDKLQTWERSAATDAKTICNGIIKLAELYKSLDDLLNLSLTIHSFSQDHDEKLKKHVLESVRLVDICGVTRDLVSQFNEHVRDLQSSLRRRKGDLSTQFTKYTSMRKKTIKDAKRSIAALKEMDCQIEALVPLDADHHHLSVVIRILREVRAISISIFQKVLIFLSAPRSKAKLSKWSVVSRWVHKGTISSENQQSHENEMESVHLTFVSLCKFNSNEAEKVQFLQSRLSSLDAQLDWMDNGLENMFRFLINSRSSLLNILYC